MATKKLLSPTPRDWRDRRFAFERHFGAVTTFSPEYNVDIGSWMPDQNADNRPSECTGYAVVDACSNQDGIRYSEDFNFMQTLQLMNVLPDHEGADLRVAAKVPCAIGLIPRDDEPAFVFPMTQAQAANHELWPNLTAEAATYKKPAYLPVRVLTQDYFDSVRSALTVGITEKRMVAVGTRWSADFEDGVVNGILPDSPSGLYWGHAYAIVGWKQIHNQPYLIAKTWQGKDYGDNGYCYFSRKLFNKLMNEWGTYAFVYEKLPTGSVEELKNQVMTLSDVIARLLTYIQNTVYGLAHAI